MDIPAMFRAAVAEFDARIRQIGDHQWQAATPDEDWAVRDLVNDVAGEDLWAPPLLAGSTIAEVGNRFDGDVLGADPRTAWTAASAGAVRAVGEQGAMDRIVHLSFGDVPGREYVLQLFADHLITRGTWPRDRRGRAPGCRARRVLRDLVRDHGGRLPQRGRDRGAAAGTRQCGRPDPAAGPFRPARLSPAASATALARPPRIGVHSRGPDAARRRAPVIELLVQVEHAFGSCLMSPGQAASRVTWLRGCGL